MPRRVCRISLTPSSPSSFLTRCDTAAIVLSFKPSPVVALLAALVAVVIYLVVPFRSCTDAARRGTLGRVIDPGASRSLKKGDLVVGIVRRPDAVPCPNCAVGEWDMCRNGHYTERGIKEIHGFMSERWRIEPEYAIKVDPPLGILGVLLEPMTVIAKALEQVVAVGQRSYWEANTVLVTGAGPIGLLAACAASMRGWEVHVLDRVETGLKPELVRALGATYHLRESHGPRVRAGRHRRVHRRRIGTCGRAPHDRGWRCPLPDKSRRGWRGPQPCRGRHRRQAGPEQQRAGCQREREQASLVQSGSGSGPGGPEVAEPPNHAPRKAGEF